MPDAPAGQRTGQGAASVLPYLLEALRRKPKDPSPGDDDPPLILRSR